MMGKEVVRLPSLGAIAIVTCPSRLDLYSSKNGYFFRNGYITINDKFLDKAL